MQATCLRGSASFSNGPIATRCAPQSRRIRRIDNRPESGPPCLGGGTTSRVARHQCCDCEGAMSFPLADGMEAGHRFELRANENTYQAVAVPAEKDDRYRLCRMGFLCRRLRGDSRQRVWKG